MANWVDKKVLTDQHCMGLAIDFFALSVMHMGCLNILWIFVMKHLGCVCFINCSSPSSQEESFNALTPKSNGGNYWGNDEIFQVSALHFISRWNKRYKFQLYSFLSIAITRMTLGSGTWQYQGRKNFTLVAHWENSYSYSFLSAFWTFWPFFRFLRAEVKITNWADKKLLIAQTLYGVSNWFLYSLSDACALFNHFCEFCNGRS